MLGYSLEAPQQGTEALIMNNHNVYFVCVEVLRPSQPDGVISNTVTLPNHTFTGQT